MAFSLKHIFQNFLLQLTAKGKNIDFGQLPFTNKRETVRDKIIHEQARSFFYRTGSAGLVIGISSSNEHTFYSYGYSDLRSKTPFQVNSIFEAGSITKTFTANLILQLEEAGMIDIQKPVSNYLPNGFGNSALAHVSTADILSHTSGLPRLPRNLSKVPGYTDDQPYAHFGKDDLFADLLSLKKIRKGYYEYSNLGFGVMTAVLEEISGKSFGQLLKQYISGPLNMDVTSIHKPDSLPKATGYYKKKPVDYWTFQIMAGAGAIQTNAGDMLKYLDAHFPTPAKPGSAVFKKIAIPLHEAAGSYKVGHAWHFIETNEFRIAWHNGGTAGFSTYAAFEPVTKKSIIVAANQSMVNNALDKMSIDIMFSLFE